MNRVIFCLLSVLLLSAECSDNENRCPTYLTNYVTINDNAEPYWFVSKFGSFINGDKVKDVPALTLHIEGTCIEKISAFPSVTKIVAEGLHNKAPLLEDLPSLNSVSFAKNRISAVPENFLTRSNPSEVTLSFNNISKIGDQAFSSDIVELYLTCNQLNNLSTNWFVNPSKLRLLNAGGNKITTIPKDMFKHFVNLDVLELRNNQIVTLEAGSLSGPNQMALLSLGYNNISEIKANVFGDAISIRTFDIQYNRLSFLHQDMMDKIQIEGVQLWGNPWQCPCQPIINAWIAKNNKDFSAGVTRDEDPTCLYAISFKNNCVPFVDPELYIKYVETFDVYITDICPKTQNENK